MPVIRLIFAGLVALGALFATLFALILVVFGAIAAFILQFFRPPRTGMKPTGPRPRSPAASARPPVRPGEDVIDI